MHSLEWRWYLASFCIGIMVINLMYFVILRKNSSDTHDHSVFFFMLAVLDIIYGAVLIAIFTQKLIEMGMSI